MISLTDLFFLANGTSLYSTDTIVCMLFCDEAFICIKFSKVVFVRFLFDTHIMYELFNCT